MKRFLSLLLVACMLFSMMGSTVLVVYAKTSGHSALEDYSFSPGHNPLPDESEEKEDIQDSTLKHEEDGEVSIEDESSTTNTLGHNPLTDESEEKEDIQDSTLKPEEDDEVSIEDESSTTNNSGHNPLPDESEEKEDIQDPTLKPEEDGEVSIEDESSITNTCSHNRIKDFFSEDDCEKYDDEKHQWTGTFIVKCRECNEVLEESTGKKKELHNFQNGKCKECNYKAKDCEHEETEKVVSYWYNSVNERGNDASYVEFDVVCVYCDIKVDTVVHYGPVTAIEASSNCDHDDVETRAVKTYYEPCTEEKHYKLTKYIVECLECEEEFNSYTEEREEHHQIVNDKCTKCIYESPKETTKTETPKDSTTTESRGKTTSEPAKEVVKNQSADSIEESSKTSDATTKSKGPVENFYISSKYTNYSVNDEIIAWKNLPKETNGKLQVPLREFAEAMGWKVTWDNEKNLAYVSDGKVTKTFIPDYDVFLMTSGEREIGVALSNESKIKDGIFYTDLDGLLEGTDYAYYKSDTTYRIAERSEIIYWVTKDEISGRNNLETSESLLKADDYAHILEENKQVYIVKEDDSFWEITLEQAALGNYYEGETTAGGIVARIIVGEVPFVGTAADLRDVISHIGEPEFTTEAKLDLLAVIPIAGLAKYLPELTKAAKNADEVVEGIEIIADLSKNADEAAEIAKGTGKLADAARASIKSVDDLKAIAKHPENFKESAWNHIFYGNRDGGYHYIGLNGEKGKIISITDPPNKYGVYRADIEINGKTTKKSTFFPDDWSPQEVVDAIEDAYANVTAKANGAVDYTMQSGMSIRLVFDEYCKIKSAFPLY